MRTLVIHVTVAVGDDHSEADLHTIHRLRVEIKHVWSIGLTEVGGGIGLGEDKAHVVVDHLLLDLLLSEAGWEALLCVHLARSAHQLVELSLTTRVGRYQQHRETDRHTEDEYVDVCVKCDLDLKRHTRRLSVRLTVSI